MCSVSVIIVNWNGLQHLKRCLDSVFALTFNNFEVIVVDNGSTDGSVDFIRENYREVILVCLTENRGFTGGNLAGYDVARGQFIALLNNDTWVEPDWLGLLSASMREQTNVGICASRIIIAGTDLIDSAGDNFTTAFTGTKIGYRQTADYFDRPYYVHGGCAAAILYRREMLEDIGFLDDDFFFNHEDTDLNIRAWLAGWKCVYVPAAIVHHKVSSSIGHLSAGTVYYFSRNNEWVWLKNIPSGLIIRLLPARVLYELFSLLYYGAGSLHLWAFLRGKIDAIRKIPGMLIKRRIIQNNVRLSDKEILKGLTPVSSYILARSRRIFYAKHN